MGKAIWATPVYLSVAWALMISYQLFTKTAVETVVANIGFVFPGVGLWLSSRIDLIIIINAFAWVFVLSSVIPSIILGKERGVLVQFFVCMILTVVSYLILDAIQTVDVLKQLIGASFLFSNLFFAVLYLSLPYIAMVAIDWYVKKRKEQSKKLGEMNQEYLEPIEETEEQTDSTSDI